MSLYRGLLMLLLLLLSTPVLAAGQEALSAPRGPIEVTAQKMDADQSRGKVLFQGDVVAKRGTMTVYSDRLTLVFVEVNKERKIERLIAEGAVRVVDGDRVATSDRLEYLQAEEKMTLTGHATIHQGGNQVAGDEIVLLLRENRSLVKSGKDGRVKAVFLPQRKNP